MKDNMSDEAWYIGKDEVKGHEKSMYQRNLILEGPFSRVALCFNNDYYNNNKG